MRTRLLLSTVLSLLPCFSARAEEPEKVCETFVINPQSESGTFKALCLAAEDKTAGRAEAFSDGRVHINVWPWCTDGKLMRCDVSGNLSEWETFWEGDEVDTWYSEFVPLLAVVCYCQHFVPPTTPEDSF